MGCGGVNRHWPPVGLHSHLSTTCMHAMYRIIGFLYNCTWLLYIWYNTSNKVNLNLYINSRLSVNHKGTERNIEHLADTFRINNSLSNQVLYQVFFIIRHNQLRCQCKVVIRFLIDYRAYSHSDHNISRCILSQALSRSSVFHSPATGLVLKWTPHLKLSVHLRISWAFSVRRVILIGLWNI